MSSDGVKLESVKMWRSVGQSGMLAVACLDMQSDELLVMVTLHKLESTRRVQTSAKAATFQSRLDFIP